MRSAEIKGIVRSAYAGFQQTSVTLEEASANLGATPLRTLHRYARLTGGSEARVP